MENGLNLQQLSPQTHPGPGFLSLKETILNTEVLRWEVTL